MSPFGRRPENWERFSGLLGSAARRDGFTGWDEVFELARSDPELLLELATFHYRHGNTAQLIRTFVRLQELAPDAIERLPVVNGTKFWRRLRDAAKAFVATWRKPGAAAQDLYDRGRILHIVGRLNEAERAYRMARAQDPDPLQDRYETQIERMKGGAIASANDALSALIAFRDRMAAELATDDVRRVGGLNGHLAAKRLAASASVLVPAAADILFAQATLADRGERFARILRAYASAIGMDEAQLASLSWIKDQVGGEPAVRAERLYLIVLELVPNHPQAMFNLAGVLARNGKVDEAARLYQEVPQRSASLAPHVTLRLAKLADRQGNHDAAQKHYAGLAAATQLGHHHVAVARNLRANGRAADALVHYAAAMGWARYTAPEYISEPAALSAHVAELRWHGNPTMAAVEQSASS